MAALFWELDCSTTPPQTPTLRTEFRHTSLVSRSPTQDSLDWPSSERVEFTRLNPSRTKDSTEGEWHMVTATRSLLGRERRGQRDCLQDQQKVPYNSLPRAHFLQPNRESSAFSPYANDKDAKNIAENSLKQHPLTQPGFYSPKIQRSKHWEAAQSTKKSLKGSSSTNNLKEFCALTLPLPCSKTAVLKPSPLCSKPQEVKTSQVKKPPLMRAVVSQSSPTSIQHGKEHFSQLQLREDHLIKNQDCILYNLQEPNIKPPKNDQLGWRQSQNSFTEDTFTKDYISINTLHLFPGRQSKADQPAKYSPKLEKACHEGVDAVIKPSQGDPDRSCQLQASQTQPDYSLKQRKIQYTLHRETGGVRNGDHNHIKSQVDGNSKNVFGKPRVIASLRAACSPRPVRRSTVVEDLKKLIVMDDTEDSAQGDSSSPEQKEAGLRSSLQMSGLCASPSFLFSSAQRSYPETPTLTPIHFHLQTPQTECGELPEQAESGLWDQRPASELMPLPSTAYDLDWNILVQAAQEYDTQRMATFLSEMSPVSSRPDTPSHGTYKIQQSSAYSSGEDMDSDVFIDFPDQLSHLEGMLRRLSSDLLKEKRDKVGLLAEVLKLRISNQHLREESLGAAAQLHKISKILNTTPGWEE
ncbi:uncharacterized protein [Pseudorasbora parva]|uniref:uncharacterized protein isoform X2 n=1 Tax=Pseudorasbora parva TaxID=51549 RepID=UPI00351F182B